MAQRNNTAELPADRPARSLSSPVAGQAAPRRWILNWWQDLLLIVGTPLIILPLMAVARALFSPEEIFLYVIALGATGHHLPGLMRAYGDRELFRRFRVRFILAPLFLLAVCLGIAFYATTDGLLFLLLLWGLWHGAMQVSRIARLYDAKAGSVAPATARLDLAMCLAWFGVGFVFSPTRMYEFLAGLSNAGGPLLPENFVPALQFGWATFAAAATLAFAVNVAIQWRRGAPPNPVKLLVMAGSFGFWCYAMIAVPHVLIAIALFEVFHAVQYLAIVWAFNRARVERGEASGRFARFLFRRHLPLVALYLLLVLGYGSLSLAKNYFDSGAAAARLLAAVFVASGFLHFYFDGFIWKLRERSIGQGLDLAGEAEAPVAGRIPGWLQHGALWCLFAVSLAAFGWRHGQGVPPSIERAENLLAAAPRSANARFGMGTALSDDGRFAAAIPFYRESLRINPDNPEARYGLGNALASEGFVNESIEQYRQAVRLNPNYAAALTNLGNYLREQGSLSDALELGRRAVAAEPKLAVAHDGLGVTLLELNRHDEAAEHLTEALRLDPQRIGTRVNLALTDLARRRLTEAETGLRAALEEDPRSLAAHLNLALVLESAGRQDEADRQLLEAARHHPAKVGAELAALAWRLSTEQESSEAERQRAARFAAAAAEVTGRRRFDILDTLAASLAAVGRYEEAVSTAEEAMALMPPDDPDRKFIAARRDLYSQGKRYFETEASR